MCSAQLEEIRTKLGAERLNLIRHSWGGRLAAEYAVKHPDRVERLALPSGRVVRLESAGHAVYADEPETFFELLTAFFAATPALRR